VIERAYGFLGYLRVVTPEHTSASLCHLSYSFLIVVESKPDNPPDDLRLLEPFPELVNYSSSFNFETMDSTEHSHTPFIIILLQYLAKHKAEVLPLVGHLNVVAWKISRRESRKRGI
jgi:amyloid beta precursor protein binding protein 1